MGAREEGSKGLIKLCYRVKNTGRSGVAMMCYRGVSV